MYSVAPRRLARALAGLSRRAGRCAALHLPRAAPGVSSGGVGAAVARRSEGRARDPVHGHGARGRRRHARLRAHRRGSLGRLRRLLGGGPARSRARLRRGAIVDTWWQTETGGIRITPIAPATPPKPGSATLPLPGVLPVLMDGAGQRLMGPGEGKLCIGYPWPGWRARSGAITTATS